MIKENLGKGPFAGIKIHPSVHTCYANDTRYKVIWELAEEKKAVLLSHTWDYSDKNPIQKFSYPDLFVSFIKKYKNVKFIFGHAGGRYNGHQAAVRIVKKFKNTFLDISGDSNWFGFIEWLVKEAGSGKILYGTDITWIDPRTQLGMVLGADISQEEKMDILAVNALKLFNL